MCVKAIKYVACIILHPNTSTCTLECCTLHMMPLYTSNGASSGDSNGDIRLQDCVPAPMTISGDKYDLGVGDPFMVGCCRLEFKYNDEWGTICHLGDTMMNGAPYVNAVVSTVACR